MKTTKKDLELDRDKYKALYRVMHAALQAAVDAHSKTNAKTWAPLEEQIFWRNLRDLVEEHAP